MIRCDNCGLQNPPGALVCRRCRRRLRGRPETTGPRRESDAELTLVVARGLVRLAWVIAGILLLGVALAFPLYRRVDPGLVGLVVATLLLGLLGRRHVASLESSAGQTAA